MTNWLIKIGWAKDREQANLILLGILGLCIFYFLIKALFFNENDTIEDVQYEDLPPEIQELIPREVFEGQ